MPASTYVLGKDCKLYYQTSAAWSRVAWANPAPDLSEITRVMEDPSLSLDCAEIDITNRSGGGWEQAAPGAFSGAFEFQILWVPSDTAFAVLQTRFLAKEVIALAILTGGSTAAGSEGLWADFAIIGFSMAQPVKGVVTARVRVKPGDSDVAPEWVTVEGASS